MKIRHLLPLALMFAFIAPLPAEPLRVLVAGMSHGHVTGFFKDADPAVVTVVGVWEPDATIWAKYAGEPRLAGVRHYVDLEEAVANSGAQAVWAFSDTKTHLQVVRAAAPHRLAVIVEKPLSISWADAKTIAGLANRYHTLVLTNYETSWYPAFWDTQRMIADGTLGPVRQIDVQMGHQGPVKIGVPPEFMSWLIDPSRGGAGALYDFGCYGANVATWWDGNRAPTSVAAQTYTFDPADYPHCDDHAVIELIYPDHQVTVTASWHWTFGRKDAAIYGEKGAIITSDSRNYLVRNGRGESQAHVAKSAPRSPLLWFAEAIRDRRDPVDDPASLANNLIVMKILDAARLSAAEHRTVQLSEFN
ncbi:MAG TPA: Gfo/Idh/MocA family oxidoreductase [Opitutaceae bacterium]|jgi:predicted dehydrogenase